MNSDKRIIAFLTVTSVLFAQFIILCAVWLLLTDNTHTDRWRDLLTFVAYLI